MKSDISVSEWIKSQIRDKELHHIGEYYQFITSKHYETPLHRYTIGFKRWLDDFKISDEELKLIPDNMEIIVGLTCGYFFRYK